MIVKEFEEKSKELKNEKPAKAVRAKKESSQSVEKAKAEEKKDSSVPKRVRATKTSTPKTTTKKTEKDDKGEK